MQCARDEWQRRGDGLIRSAQTARRRDGLIMTAVA